MVHTTCTLWCLQNFSPSDSLFFTKQLWKQQTYNSWFLCSRVAQTAQNSTLWRHVRGLHLESTSTFTFSALRSVCRKYLLWPKIPCVQPKRTLKSPATSPQILQSSPTWVPWWRLWTIQDIIRDHQMTASGSFSQTRPMLQTWVNLRKLNIVVTLVLLKATMWNTKTFRLSIRRVSSSLSWISTPTTICTFMMMTIGIVTSKSLTGTNTILLSHACMLDCCSLSAPEQHFYMFSHWRYGSSVYPGRTAQVTGGSAYLYFNPYYTYYRGFQLVYYPQDSACVGGSGSVITATGSFRVSLFNISH